MRLMAIRQAWTTKSSSIGPDLEGHRDLVSRQIIKIIGLITWLMGVIHLLTKSA